MNDKLRKNIQDFLADYKDADFGNWRTTNVLLETAVNLLQQCVVDDYKVIPRGDKIKEIACGKIKTKGE